MNERLKQLRKALSMKQNDFAASLTISQGHLSDVENGRKEVSDRIKLCTVIREMETVCGNPQREHKK